MGQQDEGEFFSSGATFEANSRCILAGKSFSPCSSKSRRAA
jgi:hypothetical protein